jgi:hypothetical protein
MTPMPKALASVTAAIAPRTPYAPRDSSILRRGTSDYWRAQYDRGLIFGDYFFVEALLRYRALHSREH